MSSKALSKPRCVVAVVSYNAARTIERTVGALDPKVVDEVIVADDASSDDTVAIARSLPEQFPWLAAPGAFTLHARPTNGGYGANQKDCYRIALEHGADIVVMVHGDFQYDPSRTAAVIEPIIKNDAHAALGTRIRSWEEAREGGMPLRRYAANRFFTRLQNAASGLALSEWHSGMRAYARPALESVLFEAFSNGFFFDTQMLFALVERGFRIAEAPVPVRYADDSSSISLLPTLSYGVRTLGRTGQHLFRRRPVW